MTGGGATLRPHLLDGTYELFRHHFGNRGRPTGGPLGGVQGVLVSVLALFSSGVTHLGVATDHVIESFRNDLWPTYKDGSGVPEEITSQFVPLEEALTALGVVVWPMVELEADDALASAATTAAADARVSQVVICTPDKDLAQCVSGSRVVQLDRRSGVVSDEAGVIEKFGVAPASIPDWLALVGDSADGFPGLPGWGKRSAAVVLSHYGHIAAIPDAAHDWPPALQRAARGAEKLAATLAEGRPLAERFLDLATLRIDPTILGDTESLRWRGPTSELAGWAERLGSAELLPRATRLAASR
ncbi:MAG TPA: 5'-3' exonuclease H3TH domain-containing protein [Acidimicrobiales bacterium]|nr:5'-3' exonuclease H3TH domain-containing protein [Acidimicrobiales bacterium]